MDLSNRAVRPPASAVGRKSIAGRDGERPVEWDGGHGLLVVRRLKAELKEIR